LVGKAEREDDMGRATEKRQLLREINAAALISRASPRKKEGISSAENQDKPTKNTVSEDVAVAKCAVVRARILATREATDRISDVTIGTGGSTRELVTEETGTTQKEIYATESPSYAVECDTSFVVINTAVKIPAQLLAKPHVHETETRGQYASIAEGTQEISTA